MRKEKNCISFLNLPRASTTQRLDGRSLGLQEAGDRDTRGTDYFEVARYGMERER